MDEQVWMYNEETGGYAQVDPEAFDTVWEEKGWILQDPPQEAHAELIATADAQAAPETPPLLNIFFPENGTFAEVPEESFSEAWEPLGWVRAPLGEDGTPQAPDGWKPSESPSSETAKADQ